MKPRVETREAGEKQGNSCRTIGGQDRPGVGTVAGWPAQRTPLRQADIQTSGTKASPMTTRGIEAKRVRATAGSVLAFRRILVPIDFSDESTRALEFAAHFGPDEGGNILLVHVVGPIYDIRGYVYGPVQQRRANEVLMRHARQRLQMLGQGYVGEKRHWRYVVRNGTAPRQILEAAEEFHAELIVIPMRGLSHARPTEVGSTAERVVRHASCPVLVLPKQKSRKGRKT